MINEANAPNRPRISKIKRWAAETGIPYSSTRDAGMRGEYPLIRIGRALYAERRDLDRWIEQRKVSA